MPVALVQENIEQGVKWDSGWQDRTLSLYRELRREAARQRPELVVWPEAAVPPLLQADPQRAQIEALAHEVRTGSRSFGEERFQRALVHQRAMYLKSIARGREK